MKLPPPLRGARAAFFFLTRLPVGGFPYSEAEWKWAAAWFPFVGLCLGLALAGIWRLAQGLGYLSAATLVLATGLLLTGALHEDGLADTADALGGATTREKIFVILKDSRIGTFGAAALVISFLLRASLLARLGPAAEGALVLTQCLSRVPPVWLMSTLPYVTPAASKSQSLVKGSISQALFATLWPALLLMLFLTQSSLSLVGATWVLLTCAAGTVLCGWRFARRAGGVTGDFLGAAQQVTESIALVSLVAIEFRGL